MASTSTTVEAGNTFRCVRDHSTTLAMLRLHDHEVAVVVVIMLDVCGLHAEYTLCAILLYN